MIRQYDEEQRLNTLLHTNILRNTVTIFDEVSSTNTLLKEAALQGAPEGACCIAHRQTAGRGQRGRVFQSDEGGLYLSVLFRPKKEQGESLLSLTSRLAVAAAYAVEEAAPVSIGIKWVNDLYIGPKKLAGILCETVYDGGDIPSFIVCGIGINISPVSFSREIAQNACCLETEAGQTVDRINLTSRLLFHMENAYRAPLSSIELREECIKRSVLLGKTVQITQGDQTFSAKALDIDEQGCLIVERDRQRQILTAGDVRVRLI